VTQIEGKILAPRRNNKEKNAWRISGTYRTWRAVILVSDMGIGPDKLLLLSRLSLDITGEKN